MSGHYHKSLLIGQLLEISLNKPVLHPVLADLPSLSISYQFVRVKGHFEVKIIVDHYLECLTLNAFSFVLIDWLSLYLTLRTITVSVDPSHGQKLLKKLRS